MAGPKEYGDFSVIKDNIEDSIFFKKTEITKWQAEAADIFAKAKARAWRRGLLRNSPTLVS